MGTKKQHFKKTRKNRKQKFKTSNTIQKGIAGYGVFAGKNYKEKEIVEICPFIEINSIHLQNTNGKHNPLRDYVFTSHLKKDHELVVFGNGSLFNHNNKPNVYYYHDSTGNRLLYYAAAKPIKKGEELFISYGAEHSVSKNPQKKSVGSTH